MAVSPEKRAQDNKEIMEVETPRPTVEKRMEHANIACLEQLCQHRTPAAPANMEEAEAEQEGEDGSKEALDSITQWVNTKGNAALKEKLQKKQTKMGHKRWTVLIT